jgi:hypothetical protein
VGKLAKCQKVSNHWPGEWTQYSLHLCVLVEKMLEKTMKRNQNNYCGSNYLQLSWLYHQLSPSHNNVLHSMHRMFFALWFLMRSRNERCQWIFTLPCSPEEDRSSQMADMEKKTHAVVFFILPAIRSLCSEAPHFQHWQLLWVSWARVASTWIGSSVVFGSEFSVVFYQKNMGNFGEMCFSRIISTNLAISGGNFAKILRSQIWIKKMLTGSFQLLFFPILIQIFLF